MSNLIRQGQSFSGRERNCVFLNLGRAPWADISAVSGLDFADDGRAIAVTDWDQDGDLDLWLANRTGPRLRLMQNECRTSHQYLRLRLVGKGSNRDAVGARVKVELDGKSSPLVKTVRAGGGFVSQSSKWLHFGLGTHTRVSSVSIRWPDGTIQKINNLQPNNSYRIDAERVPQKVNQRRELELTKRGSTAEDAAARVLLTRRLPLLDIEFETADGAPGDLQKYAGKPVLITIWASWCPLCAEELAKLAEHRADYPQLKVLALCADDVATNETSSPGNSPSSKLAPSDEIEWGRATHSTMQALEQIRSQTVYRQRSLTLPASFLVDASGRVGAIYFEPVAPAQLAKDLQIIEQPKTDMVQAFPFPGRSGLELLPVAPPDLAAAYVEGGYWQEAEEELIRYLVHTRRALNNNEIQPTQDLARKIERAYLYLGTLLRGLRRDSEARAVIQQGLELLPNSSKLQKASTASD